VKRDPRGKNRKDKAPGIIEEQKQTSSAMFGTVAKPINLFKKAKVASNPASA